MWVNRLPIARNWNGGTIAVKEVLYEFEGPVVFRAQVGFNDLLFAKRDEAGQFDFFLAAETSDALIAALRDGRISLRGALCQPDAWLIETDLSIVNGYQRIDEENLKDLLPKNNVALYHKFGHVPDTIEQADAFISFRFIGSAVRNGNVSLNTLQSKINKFSDFVRHALTPYTLHAGRDYRFFDVQMTEPRFSSLVLAAKKIEFDIPAIRRRRRLQNIDVEILSEEAERRGREFWNALEFAEVLIRQNGTLGDDFIENNAQFLLNLDGLLPSEIDGLDNVEITFNDGDNLRTAVIDRQFGERINDAQDRLRTMDNRSITGVITEVNGDARTFIVKDFTQRQTTCEIPSVYFDLLDDDGALYRGRLITIRGLFQRRIRRDKIIAEDPIIFLN